MAAYALVLPVYSKVAFPCDLLARALELLRADTEYATGTSDLGVTAAHGEEVPADKLVQPGFFPVHSGRGRFDRVNWRVGLIVLFTVYWSFPLQSLCELAVLFGFLQFRDHGLKIKITTVLVSFGARVANQTPVVQLFSRFHDDGACHVQLA